MSMRKRFEARRSRWLGWAALAVGALAVTGCKERADDEDGSSSSSASTGAGGAPSAEEAGYLATNVIATSMQYADTLFKFDPDLDPSMGADGNLATVKGNADDATCAAITTVQGGITIDYGASCTLPNGMVVSGAITVTIAKTGDTGLSVGLAFDQFVASGVDLDGTLGFMTVDGSTFTIDVALTSGGVTLDGSITAVGTPTEITVDGQATVAGAVNVTVTDVAFSPGECWPHGGEVVTKAGVLSTKMTFDANTATTGQAQQSVGPAPTSCVTLDPHGSCTPTPCP